ncbi:MAG: DNA mismatch endonuclease Vsr, partial [bacterium]|nr:DNA mismatch endonuclease Vsr [bacterium]
KFAIKGWRRNYKLPGSPDFVFTKKRITVFTDGCFWHGHDCRNTKPSTNKEYWDKKIDENKERDRKVTEILKDKNWQVIRIWECELKKSDLSEKLCCLLNTPNSNSSRPGE